MTEMPTTTAKDRVHNITVGLTGDVMLGRLVNEAVSRCADYRYPWGNMLPELRETDLLVINLETTLTNCVRRVPKVFNFKASPDKVRSLVEAGIDVCNVANNHILDFDVQGMLETLTVLDKDGIKHTGAGINLAAAAEPAVVIKNGITVGILGCTDNEPGWKATANRPGTNYIHIEQPDTVLKQVSALRPKVDWLILSIHWGPNMRPIPSRSFVQFAHRAIDHGVDILHGHSAHIFQAVEVYKRRPVLYDTGEFVDDYAVDTWLRNDISFFYILELNRHEIFTLKMLPVSIRNMQVNRAEGDDRRRAVDGIRELCKNFDTRLTGHDGYLYVDLQG